MSQQTSSAYNIGNKINITQFPPMSPDEGIALLSQRFANTTQRPNLLGMNGVSAGFHSRADLTDRIYDTNLVMNNMLSYDKHYMTTEVMPIMVSEDNYFRTVVKELEHMLPTPTPALGTSRTYRSRVHESVSVMKRYGIGAFMEGDFLRTKEGQNTFLAHVAAFHRSDRDHCVLLAYYQLLTNDMRSQFHRAIQETTDFHMYYAILKDERDCFAMPNKFARGCNKLILHNVEEMYRSNSVMPDICIAPAGKMRHLMTTGNAEMFRFSNSGPDGPANANAPYGELVKLNGVSVREAPTDLARQGYESDFQDIHNREVFLGEFGVCVQHPGADPNSMDYGIYDNVIDDHRYVTFENLFKNNQMVLHVNKGSLLPYKKLNTGGIVAPFTGYYVDVDKLAGLIDNGPFKDDTQQPHYMYEYGVTRTVNDVEEQAERNMYLYVYIRDMMITTNPKVTHEEVTNTIKLMCGHALRSDPLQTPELAAADVVLNAAGVRHYDTIYKSREDLAEKKAELRAAKKTLSAATSAAIRAGPALVPGAGPGAVPPWSTNPAVVDAKRIVDAIEIEIKAAENDIATMEANFNAAAYGTAPNHDIKRIRAQCLYEMQLLVPKVDLYTFYALMQLLYVIERDTTRPNDPEKWRVHSDYICPRHGPGGSDGKGKAGPFTFTPRDWHGSGVVGHLAVRPMNGYYMTDMILVKGGLELGFVARSIETMHIGDDVGNVSTKLEYRCHAVAHTVNPSRSRVIRNATYDGIIGGGNALVMTIDQATAVSKNLFRLDNLCSPSIYSIMIDPRKFDRETEMLHMSGCRPYDNGTPDYIGAYLYQQFYGWDKIGFSTSHGLVDHLYPIATVLYRSSMQVVGAGGQKIYITGCTHHGQNEGPGCNIVRRTGTSVIPIPMT